MWLEKEVRKMEGKLEMTSWGRECWAWHGRLSDLGLTLLLTLRKRLRVEETLTGSGQWVPGPGTWRPGTVER